MDTFTTTIIIIILLSFLSLLMVIYTYKNLLLSFSKEQKEIVITSIRTNSSLMESVKETIVSSNREVYSILNLLVKGIISKNIEDLELYDKVTSMLNEKNEILEKKIQETPESVISKLIIPKTKKLEITDEDAKKELYDN